MMKKLTSWTIVLFWSTIVSAQEFNYEATVAASATNGFHKIVLSAELLGKANVNLADLRIYDEAGIEQPYLIQQESPITTNSLFKEYKIIARENQKDSTSYLVFLNDDDRPIDNLFFVVQNTAVNKRAKLSGSKDGKNWYVIRNNYLLQSMHSLNKTTELKMLDFPLSDYSHFKLEIVDNVKEPINILKVGYFESQKAMGLSSSFDFPILNQTDSAKTSFITLKLPEVRYLEKLQFDITGAQYYSRYAKVLIKRESENKRKEKVYYYQQVGSLELNSRSSNELNTGGIQVQELYLEIDNQDNRPLQVAQATGSFLNRYAVADLEANKTYLLKFGNEQLRAPNYDITSFSDVIPPNAQKVNITEIRNVIRNSETSDEEPGLFDNPYLVWSAIGLLGIVLGYISIKMINDLKNRD